jgi:hypothetical protein
MKMLGHSVVGKTTVHDVTQTIDPDTVPLNGGFLLKTLILSIEPLVQGMMRDPSVKAALVSSRPATSDCLLTMDSSHS